MIRNILIVGILAAIGYYVWTYVEQGFDTMHKSQDQINQDAADYQKRRDAEIDKSLGDHR